MIGEMIFRDTKSAIKIIVASADTVLICGGFVAGNGNIEWGNYYPADDSLLSAMADGFKSWTENNSFKYELMFVPGLKKVQFGYKAFKFMVGDNWYQFDVERDEERKIMNAIKCAPYFFGTYTKQFPYIK